MSRFFSAAIWAAIVLVAIGASQAQEPAVIAPKATTRPLSAVTTNPSRPAPAPQSPLATPVAPDDEELFSIKQRGFPCRQCGTGPRAPGDVVRLLAVLAPESNGLTRREQ